MRIYLQLAFIILTVAPASLFAHGFADGTFQKPAKLYPGFDLNPKDFKSIFIESPKSDTRLLFNFQLPAGVSNDNKTIVVQQVEMNPHCRNMRVFKPENNSKILIAKLDPEFPYRYNMPVLKKAN